MDRAGSERIQVHVLRLRIGAQDGFPDVPERTCVDVPIVPRQPRDCCGEKGERKAKNMTDAPENPKIDWEEVVFAMKPL